MADGWCKSKSLLDAKTSNNGVLVTHPPTDWHSYPKSRDAIASKKSQNQLHVLVNALRVSRNSSLIGLEIYLNIGLKWAFKFKISSLI